MHLVNDKLIYQRRILRRVYVEGIKRCTDTTRAGKKRVFVDHAFVLRNTSTNELPKYLVLIEEKVCLTVSLRGTMFEKSSC